MKLAILERDGVICQAVEGQLTGHEAWQGWPEALAAVAQLNQAGWHVVLAAAQPGIGRGLYDCAALNDYHRQMYKELAAVGAKVDAVFFCPHSDAEHCNCRKPAPGLLEQIRDRYGVERNDVRVVGSCSAHLQAGAALGAQLHLVCTGQSAPVVPGGELPAGLPPGTQMHASLGDFVDQLLPVVLASATAVPVQASVPVPGTVIV